MPATPSDDNSPSTQLEDLTTAPPQHPVFALEVAAMRQWLTGDPDGYLEISAPDVVYTDPFMVGWLSGHDALASLYDGLRGTIHADRFAFTNPCVMEIGDAAVLTFDFVSWGDDETRWHCTEVYRRLDDTWQIVSTHWSFQPVMNSEN